MAARWAPPLPARNSKLGYDYVHSVVDDHSARHTPRSWTMRPQPPRRVSWPVSWQASQMPGSGSSGL